MQLAWKHRQCDVSDKIQDSTVRLSTFAAVPAPVAQLEGHISSTMSPETCGSITIDRAETIDAIASQAHLSRLCNGMVEWRLDRLAIFRTR